MMIARFAAALLLVACSGSSAPAPTPASQPAPAPPPAPAEASEPTTADAGETENERNARLARELEKLDQNPTASVGPDAEGVARRFIEAVNAGDKDAVIGASSPECLSGACGDLARQASKKFTLRQKGTVAVRGSRATAGADVVCTGGKLCDFVILRVERRVVQAYDQGLVSSAWAWRVVDVTENESESRAWLEATDAPDSSALDASPKKVTGPPGAVSVGSPQGGAVANASRVIAGMRAGFRRCYHRGLSEDPEASGTIRLELQIGSDGSVTRATAITKGRLPTSTVACIEARARAAQFDPPAGGGAKLVVPLTMTPN